VKQILKSLKLLCMWLAEMGEADANDCAVITMKRSNFFYRRMLLRVIADSVIRVKKD